MLVRELIAALRDRDQDAEVQILMELNGHMLTMGLDDVVYYRDGFVGIGYKRDQDATEATPTILQPLDHDAVAEALFEQEDGLDMLDCEDVANFICARFGVQPGESKEGDE